MGLRADRQTEIQIDKPAGTNEKRKLEIAAAGSCGLGRYGVYTLLKAEADDVFVVVVYDLSAVRAKLLLWWWWRRRLSHHFTA